MKKVFMSLAVVAMMVATVSCGNNTKKAEATEGEAATEVVDECCGAEDECCGAEECETPAEEVPAETPAE